MYLFVVFFMRAKYGIDVSHRGPKAEEAVLK